MLYYIVGNRTLFKYFEDYKIITVVLLIKSNEQEWRKVVCTKIVYISYLQYSNITSNMQRERVERILNIMKGTMHCFFQLNLAVSQRVCGMHGYKDESNSYRCNYK